MDFKRLLFLFLASLLVFVTAACTRSYKPSEPIELTQSVEESDGADIESPAGATEVMGQIFMLATQTAMAEQGILREAPTVEPTKVVENEQTAPQQPESQEPAPPSNPQQPAGQEEVPVPVPENPGTYVLREGEFPYCIARRYNVNPNELIRESGIAPNQNNVPAGTTLVFPKSDRTFPGKRRLENHPTDYSVGEGQTIFSIACVFGDVDPQSIIAANNLQEPFTLTAGQVLHIP
jgi:LysM repeat protein